MKLTKLDIVKNVMGIHYAPKTDIQLAVDVYFNCLTKLLAKHRHIMLAKGAFHLSVSIKEPRVGRNPKTGEKHTITKRCMVSFKQGAAAACVDAKRLVASQLLDSMVELINTDECFVSHISPHNRYGVVTYMTGLLKSVIKVMNLVWQRVTEGISTLTIRGFSNFYPKYSPERIVHNPKSGKKVTTPASTRGTIKASKVLIEHLNDVVRDGNTDTLSVFDSKYLDLHSLVRAGKEYA